MRIELIDINTALRTDPKGYVARCDALYNNRIGKAADLVVSRMNRSRVALLAGPPPPASSPGPPTPNPLPPPNRPPCPATATPSAAGT